MQFKTFTIAALLAVAFPAINALTVYSGPGCTGDQSLGIPCSGQCVDYNGPLESFRANSAGQNGVRCVALYAGPSCSGARFNYTVPGSQCTDVNTSTPINSFRCFAGVGCS